jgi:hypothetical protein
MALDILLEIFANSPPAILFALGFVLLFFGFATNNSGMANAGWAFVALGIILQAIWLLAKFRR